MIDSHNRYEIYLDSNKNAKEYFERTERTCRLLKNGKHVGQDVFSHLILIPDYKLFLITNKRSTAFDVDDFDEMILMTEYDDMKSLVEGVVYAHFYKDLDYKIISSMEDVFCQFICKDTLGASREEFFNFLFLCIRRNEAYRYEEYINLEPRSKTYTRIKGRFIKL